MKRIRTPNNRAGGMFRHILITPKISFGEGLHRHRHPGPCQAFHSGFRLS